MAMVTAIWAAAAAVIIMAGAEDVVITTAAITTATKNLEREAASVASLHSVSPRDYRMGH